MLTVCSRISPQQHLTLPRLFTTQTYQLFFFLDCSCPKGNPLAVPPIYAQKCDLEGSCYCAGDMTLLETGCKRKGKYDYILGKLLTE